MTNSFFVRLLDVHFIFDTKQPECTRRWYNGAFIERTETGSAHQSTRKWPVMCDNFHRFGMWPPGAVFGWAEQMMRLLAHLEHTGAWDRQGSLFCERLKGKICSSCRFFPHMGVVGTAKWNIRETRMCVSACVRGILSVSDEPTAKHWSSCKVLNRSPSQTRQDTSLRHRCVNHTTSTYSLLSHMYLNVNLIPAMLMHGCHIWYLTSDLLGHKNHARLINQEEKIGLTWV